jgi:hypothetical protein
MQRLRLAHRRAKKLQVEAGAGAYRPLVFVITARRRAQPSLCSTTPTPPLTPHIMAAASAMRPVVASMRAAIGASKRTFATANKQSFASRAQPSPRASLSHAQLGQSFRRSYADAVKPIKPKKSGFRIFRWAWRATYLSAIAGLAYTAYGIYEMKNPGDQAEPDPSKKTLVILGMCLESLPHGLH